MLLYNLYNMLLIFLIRVIIKYLLIKVVYTGQLVQIIKRLDDLSKINIFIGSNNCGKSRFLSFIFQFKDNGEVVFFFKWLWSFRFFL